MAHRSIWEPEALIGAEPARAYIVRVRGDLIGTTLLSAGAFVHARGPESLEAALAPDPILHKMLGPDERRRALEAIRTLNSLPGYVWEAVGGFSWASVKAPLAALEEQLERVPTRRQGRPPDPGLFARHMLEFGAGQLAVLGCEQLNPMELAAVAVAVGADDGTQGNDRAYEAMKDVWRKHHRKYLPEHPERLEQAARERVDERRLHVMVEMVKARN